MASIHREAVLEVPVAFAWDALRDVGALHTRLAKGFAVDTRMEEGGAARVVTFANGVVARELIIDVDDERRRVAWSAVSERMTHHNASAQLFEVDPRHCRFVWIADLLPHDVAPMIAQMIDAGMAAIRKTLEQSHRERPR